MAATVRAHAVLTNNTLLFFLLVRRISLFLSKVLTIENQIKGKVLNYSSDLECCAAFLNEQYLSHIEYRLWACLLSDKARVSASHESAINLATQKWRFLDHARRLDVMQMEHLSQIGAAVLMISKGSRYIPMTLHE